MRPSGGLNHKLSSVEGVNAIGKRNVWTELVTAGVVLPASWLAGEFDHEWVASFGFLFGIGCIFAAAIDADANQRNKKSSSA